MTKKILVLTSNPQGTAPLLLNQEIRDIKEKLRNSSHGHHFLVNDELAVRTDDLQPTILREQPRFVHFCGHGAGTPGLIVESPSGESQLVNTSALTNLFKLFASQIECVVLNACYTETQAQEIHQHINFVIGTTRAIPDSAAIDFSKGFYGALGEGKSIEEAYQLGCNRIELGMNVTKYPERKLVPVESEQELKYLDRSDNVVLTLLKKEPLNQIVDHNINQENIQQNKMSKRNINIQHGNYNENIEGDYIDNSHRLNISGETINASGAGAFSLGDNYGTIANLINQLPTSPNPEESGIKELLTQLQTAVDDPQLSEDDKQQVLEQLQVLAEAGQNPQDETMQKKAERAVGFLEVIAKGVEPASKLAKACTKVLPKIIAFFV